MCVCITLVNYKHIIIVAAEHHFKFLFQAACVSVKRGVCLEDEASPASPQWEVEVVEVGCCLKSRWPQRWQGHVANVLAMYPCVLRVGRFTRKVGRIEVNTERTDSKIAAISLVSPMVLGYKRVQPLDDGKHKLYIYIYSIIYTYTLYQHRWVFFVFPCILSMYETVACVYLPA